MPEGVEGRAQAGGRREAEKRGRGEEENASLCSRVGRLRLFLATFTCPRTHLSAGVPYSRRLQVFLFNRCNQVENTFIETGDLETSVYRYSARRRNNGCTYDGLLAARAQRVSHSGIAFYLPPSTDRVSLQVNASSPHRELETALFALKVS